MFHRISCISTVVLAVAAGVRAATEPCAEISDEFKNGTTSFDPQLTLACLESMPFISSRAVTFIDEITKYVQWQSDLEILKNPPIDYLSPAVDVLGGLANIRSKALANGYKSQWDFDNDLYFLVTSANSAHFQIFPCSLNIFGWGTATSLTSVSIDGVTIPQIYTAGDSRLLGNGTKEVSPVTFINGVGAEGFLEQLSSHQPFQDPDARYNDMLANFPIDGQGQVHTGSFALANTFPGAFSYNLTHANGSVTIVPVIAILGVANFTAKDGQELLETVCLPIPATTSSSSSAQGSNATIPTTTPLDPPRNYPAPVARNQYNTFLGYFLEEATLNDVAVLQVPTFDTTGPFLDGVIPASNVRDFIVGVDSFVKNATAEGKKKIIIDVTNNGGGTVVSGYALASIFFPNMTLYSGTRYRSTPSTEFLIRSYSSRNFSLLDPTLPTTSFSVQFSVRPDQKTPFTSENELLGPFDVLGVPSSGLVAGVNFPVEIMPELDPINVFGLGGPLNSTTPPFAPEDIIILTDGRCSSTCTIFVNHMIPRGVRVVTVGGRPQSGPMQSLGGVKGSELLTLPVLSSYFDFARELIANASAAGQPIFSDTELANLNESVPIPIGDLSFQIGNAGINFRNAFAPGNDEVPTHYIYQAADCRLFYTAGSVFRPELTWASAANAIWGNGKCAFKKPANVVTEETEEASVTSPNGVHKMLGLLLALSRGMKS
ncbi:hypothetical protein F5884DRAFT_885765 [Xylogone sp. PMI_703]|nr:hypothetical protein F5884DRAFT_885765 [Xylogone sp. PMI_703]